MMPTYIDIPQPQPEQLTSILSPTDYSVVLATYNMAVCHVTVHGWTNDPEGVSIMILQRDDTDRYRRNWGSGEVSLIVFHGRLSRATELHANKLNIAMNGGIYEVRLGNHPPADEIMDLTQAYARAKWDAVHGARIINEMEE